MTPLQCRGDREGPCAVILLAAPGKIIDISGRYNVKPGDSVTVLMKQSMGYSALFLGYILPVILVLVTLAIMISMDAGELAAGLLSLSVLIPYYLILFLLKKRINEIFTFTLKV